MKKVINKNKKELINFCEEMDFVVQSGCSDGPNNLNICIKNTKSMKGCYYPTQIEVWFGKVDGSQFLYRDYRYSMDDYGVGQNKTFDEKYTNNYGQLSDYVSLDELKKVITERGTHIYVGGCRHIKKEEWDLLPSLNEKEVV